ncbi:MAG: cupin domain-containing protein [Anaerolineae bacterium]|nr:cupin domain-containing protein [Anaerolineae bacterium]
MPDLLHIDDLYASFNSIPTDSIVSRTVLDTDQIKAVAFGFAQGQELSEHTASMPAVIHFLKGEAHVALGDQEIEAVPGTWVHMPAKMAHSITAKSEVVMLLLLLK